MSTSKMSQTKQVKVDNWGVFFLQRLKHFFNRTDYCDLTLQFQDYAQLKVHRLVLNACTEYFELLERTCEMYDDCLIMPDDLPVDVVVPIVNFMYTGQLEYEYSLFDRLYATAQVMNMPVLTKLLEAQKQNPPPKKAVKKEPIVMNAHLNDKGLYTSPSTSAEAKFPKKRIITGRQYGPGPGLKVESPGKPIFLKEPLKIKNEKPRPTRYEVPEELESDEIFESSFADISYESRPPMSVAKRQREPPSIERVRNIYDEASCSRKFEELQMSSSYKKPRLSSDDEGDKVDLEQVNEFTYEQKIRSEYNLEHAGQSEDEIFDSINNDNPDSLTLSPDKDSIFSHSNENSPNISIKQTGKTSNLDHAKIISEVLKKYPHLVKNNKNIKLKIMSGYDKGQQSPKSMGKNFPAEPPKKFVKNPTSVIKNYNQDQSEPDWTYVNKNMNSEAMGKLVSLGIANTSGPWLCLLCGTPGKALNFPTYNKYYHHLSRVHSEKISANICEHCGYKSGKRNHLLHHMYTKHDIPPPSTHSFPKCNQCPYIALTEAFLIKHKLSHVDNREFSCNVCNTSFRTRAQLLNHIQLTGHKISPDRKTANQCVYCNKMFLRETNLYTHLKLAHKDISRRDGIIDNSDEEDCNEPMPIAVPKYEDNVQSYGYSSNPMEEHVNIKQEYDGKIQIISNVPVKKPIRGQQLLLNSNLNAKSSKEKKIISSVAKNINISTSSQLLDENSESISGEMSSNLGLVDRIVVLNDNQYIIQSDHGDNLSMGHVQLDIGENQEVILSDLPGDEYDHSTMEVSMPQQTSTSQIMASRSQKLAPKILTPQRPLVNRQNQPFQIVMSGNQQYKTVVSTAPIVYTAGGEMPTTASPKYVMSNMQSPNLQATADGTVMVLQDEEFNIDPNMPSDGSNIVVVYSHPIGDDGKQYVQVDGNHYADIHSTHQVVSHVEQVEEGNEGEEILSDHGLVHETVETWHDESAPIPQSNEKVDTQMMQTSEETIVHQEIPFEADKIIDTSDPNIAEDIVVSEKSNTDPLHIEEAETNEVEVCTEEVSKDSCPTIEQVVENSENGNSIDQESCPDVQNVSEEPEVQLVLQYDSTEEEIEANTAITQTHTVANTQVEPIEKLASEWSDDEITAKEIADQPENSESTAEPALQVHDEQMEVEEECIENIEKEVQKHMQNNEIETSDVQTPPEFVKGSKEENPDVESTLLTDQGEGDSQDTGGSQSPIVEKVNTSTLKQKTVEKISNLLNDWEDTDSQADPGNDTHSDVGNDSQSDTINDVQGDAVEVDAKKNAPDLTDSSSQKAPSIQKLVSDWDDDDDGK